MYISVGLSLVRGQPASGDSPKNYSPSHRSCHQPTAFGVSWTPSVFFLEFQLTWSCPLLIKEPQLLGVNEYIFLQHFATLPSLPPIILSLSSFVMIPSALAEVFMRMSFVMLSIHNHLWLALGEALSFWVDKVHATVYKWLMLVIQHSR